MCASSKTITPGTTKTSDLVWWWRQRVNDVAGIGTIIHGTTVGTNALVEGKGVKTGLLVTEGFRGIYEVAEQARPYGAAIFDVLYDKPAMLVPASLTGEVAERVATTVAA